MPGAWLGRKLTNGWEASELVFWLQSLTTLTGGIFMKLPGCCSLTPAITLLLNFPCLAGNIFICHKLAASRPAGQEESDSEDEFSAGVMYKIGRF